MNYVPTSPIIRRGSAPKGTFQIPDEGLRISHADSFLSRFWKSRSASKPTAERGSDTSATPVTENANSSRSSSDRHLHAKSADAEEIAASVTKLNISSNSTPADDSSRRAANGTRAQENAHASKVYKSEPSKAQKEVTSTVTESFSAPIAVPSVQQKTAEQEADEVEDTLINVISDTDSLLYDGRPSYPTLRFCAAKGLLDQQALEHLVSIILISFDAFGEA